jgi:hypothetical protein
MIGAEVTGGSWLGRTLGMVVAAAAFVMLSGPLSLSEAAGDLFFYQMSWNARGVSAELLVNGVPISSDDFEFEGAGSLPANLWLKPGKNSIVVRVRAYPRQGGGDAYYSLVVTKAKGGQFADEGEKLASYEWKAGTSKEALPQEKSFELTPAPPLILELWTRTETLVLDSGTEREAREFLKAVGDAYANYDLERVWALTEFKNLEYLRALSDQTRSPAEFKKELKVFFETLKGQKARFAPIDTATARLTLLADGRLIKCRTRDGKEVLVAGTGDGQEIVIPLYLARVNGRWVVAR